jgi:tRNA 2-thiouridine synthesizing protein A
VSEHHLVDARGSFCPGPLMELIAAMKRAAVGDTFELLSSDQGSAKDVPEWVRKVGHVMEKTEQDDARVWHLFIRKAK